MQFISSSHTVSQLSSVLPNPTDKSLSACPTVSLSVRLSHCLLIIKDYRKWLSRHIKAQSHQLAEASTVVARYHLQRRPQASPQCSLQCRPTARPKATLVHVGNSIRPGKCNLIIAVCQRDYYAAQHLCQLISMCGFAIYEQQQQQQHSPHCAHRI